MNIDPEFVGEVENLRKAAKENYVVFNLLMLIKRSIFIDDDGNREIVADDDDTRLLRICDITAAFAKYDIDPLAYSDSNKEFKSKF